MLPAPDIRQQVPPPIVPPLAPPVLDIGQPAPRPATPPVDPPVSRFDQPPATPPRRLSASHFDQPILPPVTPRQQQLPVRAVAAKHSIRRIDFNELAKNSSSHGLEPGEVPMARRMQMMQEQKAMQEQAADAAQPPQSPRAPQSPRTPQTSRSDKSMRAFFEPQTESPGFQHQDGDEDNDHDYDTGGRPAEDGGDTIQRAVRPSSVRQQEKSYEPRDNSATNVSDNLKLDLGECSLTRSPLHPLIANSSAVHGFYNEGISVEEIP